MPSWCGCGQCEGAKGERQRVFDVVGGVGTHPFTAWEIQSFAPPSAALPAFLLVKRTCRVPSSALIRNRRGRVGGWVDPEAVFSVRADHPTQQCCSRLDMLQCAQAHTSLRVAARGSSDRSTAATHAELS